ncbi:MAG: hypothetical protein HY787_10210 [Deltaproteobacteria bacterium]|nr:hypothetical protein [Deltaproteobacteria bacterium]
MKPSRPMPSVFVSMPLGRKSDEKYQLVIKPACHSAGAVCERADELAFAGSILQEIYFRIAKADVVIADISQANPNVWYELGYAHALGKNTLLLAENPQDVPVDLAAHRIIFSGRGEIGLREELSRALKDVLPQREGQRRGKRKAEPGVAQERISAIVFGDIVGSSAMMRTLGELDFGQFLKHYFVRVDGIVRKHEGDLLKFLGDSFLAVFSTSDDAVAFAFDLGKTRLDDAIPKAPTIQIRFGIHFGPVSIRRTPYGEDVFGKAVVIAARLADAAGLGEILLSSTAMSSLSTNRFGSVLSKRELSLKGVAQKQEVSVLSLSGKRSGDE